VRIRVVDPDDPAVDDYRALTDVALRSRMEPANGLFMAEGEKVIRRAIESGYRPRSFLLEPRWLEALADVLADADRAGVPVLVSSPDVVRGVTGYRVHRGALASMHRRPLPVTADLLADARTVVVLEDVVDHTNVGAVIRSAAALGVDAVLVTPSCADPLYRRSVRVSMGTVFQVPWTRLDAWPGSVADLRAAGFAIAALALDDDAVPLETFAASRPERVAVVLGAEGDGLARRTVAACDLVVRIPMGGGVDSLNVAAAGAVAFWALRRPAPSRGLVNGGA
jgi:tRNA G18 (ribose-2'-O)-methylase SpoU